MKQYCLLLIIFCTYFFECTNFKKWNNWTNFLLISAFFIIFCFFILSQKSVTRGPPGLLSSRVMSRFAISSHKYTITLYNPEHLEIIWELFAKKKQLTSWAFATHSLLFLPRDTSLDSNLLSALLMKTINYEKTILIECMQL